MSHLRRIVTGVLFLSLVGVFPLHTEEAKEETKKETQPESKEEKTLFTPSATEISATAGVRGLGLEKKKEKKKKKKKKGWKSGKKKKRRGPYGDR